MAIGDILWLLVIYYCPNKGLLGIKRGELAHRLIPDTESERVVWIKIIMGSWISLCYDITLITPDIRLMVIMLIF